MDQQEPKSRLRPDVRWGLALVPACIGAAIVAGLWMGRWSWVSHVELRNWLLLYQSALLVLGALCSLGVAVLAPRGGRSLRAVASVTACICLLLALLVGLVEEGHRWGWILAALPSSLVVHHAVFVHLYRRPFQSSPHYPATRDEEEEIDLLRDVLDTVTEQNRKYFDPVTLAARYGVPAVLITVISVAQLYVLFVLPSGSLFVDKLNLYHAAQVGAAGAYVYVLLHLGDRSVRHDITSGGASWCAVVLALGPLLAASLQVILKTDLKNTQGFTAYAPYFLAGLAPRQVARWVEEAIRRLWFPSATTTPAARSIPLNQVRGIAGPIEDRLGEEGISDVNALAMADPLKLFRNTNFDKRLILSWMDEALLMVSLPKAWQAIEDEGITGAMDLAWYQHATRSAGPVVAVAGGNAATQASADSLDGLAKRVKVDPGALRDVVERLYEDAQVRLVWALYQFVNGNELDGGAALQGAGTGTVGAVVK